jgi:hypothetical protein
MPLPGSARVFFRTLPSACALAAALAAAPDAAPLPLVPNVEHQPLVSQVRRVVQAADILGSPVSDADKERLAAAYADTDPARSSEAIQRILDPYCLIAVDINPEMRVHAEPGPARPDLLEDGWRQFLVKVRNEAGTTAVLRAYSPEAQSVFVPVQPRRLTESDAAFRGSPDAESLPLSSRWMDLQLYDGPPLADALSGLPLEYRIIQVYSRDAGRREATLTLDVGQGTQDLGFRSELPILFTCAPAGAVTLHVLDEDGKPTIAAFLIRDPQGRVYPSQAKRLAPDFAFQPQVYRGDGEVLRLPRGAYTVQFSRGPESIVRTRTLEVTGAPQEATFQVERWIDPSKSGWWSGDHHIHAAGCMHYGKPTQGVLPADMIRHVIGEDLKVGANLTWGPCFDFQKQFFCGTEDKVSRYPYLLRYDIEVSGFGSHQSGHLDLLKLSQQLYPHSESTNGWPTLCLDTLRWAKAQGAVVGFAHSGWGLAVRGTAVPSYEVPRFDGIGANEYIVDVTHELPGPDLRPQPAVDFISAGDTPPVYELSIWYHTLNAGYRTRIAGETDFPCISGERVGIGRSYVKLDGPLTYDDWCEGLRSGRSYVSDGKSHLMAFRADGLGVGEAGSELRLAAPATVTLTVRAAALLGDTPDPRLRGLGTLSGGDYGSNADRPFWSIERARIGTTNEVPVEVVVNGQPVAAQRIAADGAVRLLTFAVPIERSSWVALRILGSSHTNPFFVLVGGRPIRASRRSLDWCLKSVDQCWSQKEQFISADERDAALAAYEHARQAYRQRLGECEAD